MKTLRTQFLVPTVRSARSVTMAAFGLILALGAAAVGTAHPAAAAFSATTAPSSGSTLRIAADTSISTFNPFLAYFNGELNVLGSIYPTLTTINEQGQPAPYLATSWTTSANKLIWIFQIRSGVRWTDGVPITAEDAA